MRASFAGSRSAAGYTVTTSRPAAASSVKWFAWLPSATEPPRRNSRASRRRPTRCASSRKKGAPLGSLGFSPSPTNTIGALGKRRCKASRCVDFPRPFSPMNCKAKPGSQSLRIQFASVRSSTIASPPRSLRSGSPKGLRLRFRCAKAKRGRDDPPSFPNPVASASDSVTIVSGGCVSGHAVEGRLAMERRPMPGPPTPARFVTRDEHWRAVQCCGNVAATRISGAKGSCSDAVEALRGRNKSRSK